MNAYELYSCLKKLDMWPQSAKQKWVHQVTGAYHLRDQYVPRHINALIDEVLSGLPSFKYNHHHDPNNGQFTSGPSDNVIDDPPIQPVYPIETILSALTGGSALRAALSLIGSGLQNATGSTIDTAAQAIEDYLGGKPDKTFTNDTGDLILMNGDKKIRFDINNYAPHDEPHFHIETQNSSGDWTDAGDQHWYPFSKE